jgi:magnesium transporter
MRQFEGGYEALATIYLVNARKKLTGAVPLVRIATSLGASPLSSLIVEQLVSCPADASDDDVAELFDKYNLITVPVVDEHGRLAGIITADDVISLLRNRD